jgi:hypothetical protein
MAKGQNLPTVVVGHVTKDGSLAGPKVLEHVVDTVLLLSALTLAWMLRLTPGDAPAHGPPSAVRPSHACRAVWSLA